MAYTFGAATSNLISFGNNGTSCFTTNRTALVTCWVYPTTLTATRCLWGSGPTWRLAIDTTTSSCRFNTAGTGAGVFTFPAGLALNTWTFVALFVNCGAGATMDVNAWTSTPGGPIVKQTVTVVTAPTGSFTTSNLIFAAGNTSGAPTLSWQGDIAALAVFAENSGSVPGVLGVLGDGATSTAEADSVASRWVVPLWRGDVSKVAWNGSLGVNEPASGTAYAGLQLIAPLEDHLMTLKPTTGGVVAGFSSGATVSARRSPRPFQMVNDTPFLNYRTRTPQAVG